MLPRHNVVSQEMRQATHVQKMRNPRLRAVLMFVFARPGMLTWLVSGGRLSQTFHEPSTKFRLQNMFCLGPCGKQTPNSAFPSTVTHGGYSVVCGFKQALFLYPIILPQKPVDILIATCALDCSRRRVCLADALYKVCFLNNISCIT